MEKMKAGSGHFVLGNGGDVDRFGLSFKENVDLSRSMLYDQELGMEGRWEVVKEEMLDKVWKSVEEEETGDGGDHFDQLAGMFDSPELIDYYQRDEECFIFEQEVNSELEDGVESVENVKTMIISILEDILASVYSRTRTSPSSQASHPVCSSSSYHRAGTNPPIHTSHPIRPPKSMYVYG